MQRIIPHSNLLTRESVTDNARHRMFKTWKGPEVSSDKSLIPTFAQEKLCDNTDGAFKV
jgi:hypothetical protein